MVGGSGRPGASLGVLSFSLRSPLIEPSSVIDVAYWPIVLQVARRLFECGIATLRYQFPYMEARIRRPDPLPEDRALRGLEHQSLLGSSRTRPPGDACSICR